MADDTPPSDGIGDQGPIILGVTWPIAAIAIALLGARFYSSHFIVQRMKADFYIAAFTYVSCDEPEYLPSIELKLMEVLKAIAIIAEVTGTIAVNFAIGKHISTLSPDAIAEGLEYVWISQILFVAGMALGKCAIVAFLLQIRGPHEPRAGPIILWIIAISNIFVNGITILFILLQCQPVERLWDERISGTCNGRERNQNFAFFQGSQHSWISKSLLGANCLSASRLVQCQRYGISPVSAPHPLEAAGAITRQGWLGCLDGAGCSVSRDPIVQSLHQQD